MRTALRRRKADVAGSVRRSRTLRVSDATHADLARLAAKVGIPAVTVLGHLVQVALTDKQMQALVTKLAVAVSTKA